MLYKQNRLVIRFRNLSMFRFFSLKTNSFFSLCCYWHTIQWSENLETMQKTCHYYVQKNVFIFSKCFYGSRKLKKFSAIHTEITKAIKLCIKLSIKNCLACWLEFFWSNLKPSYSHFFFSGMTGHLKQK